MSNILFIYENDMPTVSIARNFWSGLSEKYGIFSRFVRLQHILSFDVDWCDVLFLIRPNNDYAWKIAKKARYIGKFIVTMCDDDLLNLPKEYPDLPWHRGGLIKALNYSDVLISSSRYLLDKMVEYTAGKRGVLIDTVVRPEEILKRSYNLQEHIVKIVYAAGSQHEKLFEKFVLPALKQVAVQYSNRFSLSFVSVHPNCDGMEKLIPVSYVKGMPLNEYRRYMEEQKFDIGISPLECNEFSKCKYFNKYLEYTLSGIVGIYSNVEPYTDVVEDGYNGILAENTLESWKEKFILLLDNPSLRRLCSQNAQKHVAEKFSEEAVMKHILDELPEISQSKEKLYRKCSSLAVQRLWYRILRCLDYIYKLFFYLKSEGLKSVCRKAVSHIKQLSFICCF